ncbi:LysR family transcriptional regulator [Pseudoxanthomonas sp.]|uniref:LysR family transcriptional regulator n=1 Tax=Pseudoxanthomonas sp. TaxID=1871049 RepID=UPI0026166CB3|nr:LysR family transcriptional regulator [Pseudoxanthomonas sp.]WDS35044.1 MAG: LysR family transcriptional regulator [Pseudoxanthomonas sp.]
MRYQKLDLNLLSALKVLLEKKNVTRAGEEMYVTQSAMSGILARLRDYFDDPLIVQVGRKMELTPLAESLIEPVNDVLLRIDATIATRPDFDPLAMRRHFTIVVSDYVSSVFLCEVLRRVHSKAPGITWRLCAPSERAPAQLESGEVDFIIHPEQLASITQSHEVLFEDSYVMAVARDNQQIGDTISLEQYLAASHVTFQSSSQGLPMFETWFGRQHGEDARRVEVVTNSFHVLPQLVVGTGRVATLHARMASTFLQGLPIRLVRPLFEVPRLVEVLQWHRYRDQDPGNQWVRERIIEMARQIPSLEAVHPLGAVPAKPAASVVPLRAAGA